MPLKGQIYNCMDTFCIFLLNTFLSLWYVSNFLARFELLKSSRSIVSMSGLILMQIIAPFWHLLASVSIYRYDILSDVLWRLHWLYTLFGRKLMTAYRGGEIVKLHLCICHTNLVYRVSLILTCYLWYFERRVTYVALVPVPAVQYSASVKKTFLNIIGSLASCFFSSRLATLLSFCTLLNTLLGVCIVCIRCHLGLFQYWLGIVSGLFLMPTVFIIAIFLLGDNIVAHTLWYSFVQRNIFYLVLKWMAVLYNLYLNSFNLLTLTILQWKCFLFARRPTCANSQVFGHRQCFCVGQWSRRPLFLSTLLEDVATCGALYSFLC